MKKIILCGHTGSRNRGCEAIVRSTVSILEKTGNYDIKAMTFDVGFDNEVGLNNQVELISYPQKNFFQKGFTLFAKRILKNVSIGNRCMYTPLFKSIPNIDVAFNIGGDVYCYGTPSLSYALNDLTSEKKIKSVFWGCSVEERALTDNRMQNDINKYSYIVARESLSYEILNQIVKDKSKIYLACDPAFNLQMRKTELPEGFVEGNTFGINLSHLVIKEKDYLNDNMYLNIVNLVDYILTYTNMHICLVPHVYNIENNSQDYYILSGLYNKYSDNDRVSLVNNELSCTELKYIISKCRYFVGARTHSMIAAYSTGVPAIALSYSIKSRGIAKDLFGTEEGYVVGRNDLDGDNKLIEVCKNTLFDNESVIKQKYNEFLPDYKQTIINVTSKILK